MLQFKHLLENLLEKKATNSSQILLHLVAVLFVTLCTLVSGGIQNF